MPFQQFLHFWQLNFYEYTGFYLVYFFLFIFVVIVAIVDAVYVSRSFQTRKFKALWPITLLRVLGTTLTRFAYIPVLKILLLIFSSKQESALPVYFRWGTIGRIILCCISPMVMLLLIIFVIPVAFTFHEPSPVAKNAMARVTGIPDLIYVIGRTALVAMTVFQASAWWRAFILGALCLVLLIIIATRVPYYWLPLNIFQCIKFSSTFAAACWLFLVGSGDDSYGGIIGWSISVIPIAVISGALPVLRRRLVSRKLSVIFQNWEGKEMEDVDAEDAQDSVVPSPSIPLSATRNRTLSSTSLMSDGGGDRIYLAEYEVEMSTREFVARKTRTHTSLAKAAELYQRGIDQFPASSRVLIDYAVFLVSYHRNFPLAMTQIRKAATLSPNLETRFLIHYYSREFEQRMQKRTIGGHGSTMDLMSFVEFQKHMAIAPKYHLETLKATKSFWCLLMADHVDLNALPIAVKRIDEFEMKATVAFMHLMERYPKNKMLLRAYGRFLEEVKRDTETAEECFRMADEQEGEHARIDRVKRERANRRLAEGRSTPVKETRPKVQFHDLESHPEPASDAEEQGPEVLRSLGSAASATSGTETSSRRANTRYQELKSNIILNRNRSVTKLARNVVFAVLIMLGLSITLYIVLVMRANMFIAVVEKINASSLRRDSAVRLAHASASVQGTAQRTDPAMNDFGNEISGIHTWSMLDDSRFPGDGRIELGASHFMYHIKYEMEQFDKTHNMLYFGDSKTSVDTAAESVALWNNPSIECRETNAGAHGGITGKKTMFNLFNLGLNVINTASVLLSTSWEAYSNATESKEYNWLQVNGLDCVLSAFDKATLTYVDENRAALNEVAVQLVLLLVGACIVVIFLALFLFRPTFSVIARERSAALRLFMFIPKSSIRKVFDVTRTTLAGDKTIPGEAGVQLEEADQEAAEAEIALATKKMSNTTRGRDATKQLMRLFTIRYVISLMAILAVFTVSVILSIEALYSALAFPAEIAWSGRETALASLMTKTLNDLFSGTLPYGTAEEHLKIFDSAAEEAAEIHFGLRFGDESRGLPMFHHRFPPHDQFLYEKGCVYELPDEVLETIHGGDQRAILQAKTRAHHFCDVRKLSKEYLGITRNGLDHIVSYFLSNSVELRHVYASMAAAGNDTLEWAGQDSIFHMLLQMSDSDLHAGMMTSMNLFVEEAHVLAEQSSSRDLTIFLIACGMIILVLVVTFIPMITALRRESSLTASLLLMIPPDTINSVPEIQHHFESRAVGVGHDDDEGQGNWFYRLFNRSSNQDEDAILQTNESRVILQSVFDTASVGLIIASRHGKILKANKIATELFKSAEKQPVEPVESKSPKKKVVSSSDDEQDDGKSGMAQLVREIVKQNMADGQPRHTVTGTNRPVKFNAKEKAIEVGRSTKKRIVICVEDNQELSSAQQLNALVDISRAGLMTVSEHGKILEFGAERLTGWAEGDVVGTSVSRIVSGAEPKALRSLAQQEKAISRTMVRPNGTQFPARMRVVGRGADAFTLAIVRTSGQTYSGQLKGHDAESPRTPRSPNGKG